MEAKDRLWSVIETEIAEQVRSKTFKLRQQRDTIVKQQKVAKDQVQGLTGEVEKLRGELKTANEKIRRLVAERLEARLKSEHIRV